MAPSSCSPSVRGENGFLPRVTRLSAPMVSWPLHGVRQVRPMPRPDHCSWPGVLTPRSEEHTSELQSLMRISYAVFCLNKKKHKPLYHTHQKYNTPPASHTTTTQPQI